MRILILSWRDLRHRQSGGSEVYVSHLAERWAALGHDVTVFAAAVPGAPGTEDVAGYRIIRRGRRLSVYAQARRWYRAEGVGCYDVVLDVINTRPFLSPDWVEDVPVVALIHQVARDVWRYEVPLPLAWVGRYVLEPRWLRRYRDVPVLTVSASSRASLVPYGLNRCTVVPEGSDPAPGVPPAELEARPTMLFVGRLAPNKRPDDALAAFRIVRRALPDAQMWFVGEGPMRASLERAAPDGTVFFGRVPEAEKRDLMRRSHALVVTSVREGWGLVVSEAAQQGLRSVAYDVPGLRDSVPAADGLLTLPTPAALASALVNEWSDRSHLTWTPPEDIGTKPWVDVADEVLEAIGAAITSWPSTGAGR